MVNLEISEKGVAQLAIEGVAKQLLQRGDATDLDQAIGLAFRLRPDLYKLYRKESFTTQVVTKRVVPALGRTSAQTKLEAIARTFLNAGDPPTFSLALDRAIRENGALYEEHLAEWRRGIETGAAGIPAGS